MIKWKTEGSTGNVISMKQNSRLADGQNRQGEGHAEWGSQYIPDVDGESNLTGEDFQQASTSRVICIVREERVCK